MSQCAEPTPEAILGRALRLRARIREVMADSVAIAPTLCCPPPQLVGPDTVLRQAIAAHAIASSARARADALGRIETHRDVLASAERLLERVARSRTRAERALSSSEARILLVQAAKLRKEIAHALARVRLVPGVVTG